jgi:hypothetical protein
LDTDFFLNSPVHDILKSFYFIPKRLNRPVCLPGQLIYTVNGKVLFKSTLAMYTLENWKEKPHQDSSCSNLTGLKPRLMLKLSVTTATSSGVSPFANVS